MTAVGLFGGTFDPVHNGHVKLAGAVLRCNIIDRIVFLPTGVPPHKIGKQGCAIGHRLQMVRLAVEGIDDCAVSDLEARVDRPSYTIDTITALRVQGLARLCYYYLTGGDAFLEIETWYRWRELLASTSFIVVFRSGYPRQNVQDLLSCHGFIMKEDGKVARWLHPDNDNEVYLLTVDIADISSTDIRRKIEQGLPWRHLVPKQVATYIDAHGLYLQK